MSENQENNSQSNDDSNTKSSESTEHIPLRGSAKASSATDDGTLHVRGFKKKGFFSSLFDAVTGSQSTDNPFSIPLLREQKKWKIEAMKLNRIFIVVIVLVLGGLCSWNKTNGNSKDLWLIIGPLVGSGLGLMAGKQTESRDK